MWCTENKIYGHRWRVFLSFFNASPQHGNHTVLRFTSVMIGTRISTDSDANRNNDWSLTVIIKSSPIQSKELNGKSINSYHLIIPSHLITCSAPWHSWNLISTKAAFICGPEWHTVPPTRIKENNVNRINGGLEMGIKGSKMQKWSCYISGCRIPEHPKHVTTSELGAVTVKGHQ